MIGDKRRIELIIQRVRARVLLARVKRHGVAHVHGKRIGGFLELHPVDAVPVVDEVTLVVNEAVRVV